MDAAIVSQAVHVLAELGDVFERHCPTDHCSESLHAGWCVRCSKHARE